jgi:WD40 repeat protein
MTGPHFHIWSLETGSEILRMDAPRSGPVISQQFHSLELTPDWRFAAVGLTSGQVALVNLETGAEVRTFQTDAYSIQKLRFTPDYSGLIAFGIKGNHFNRRSAHLYQWDIATGKEVFKRVEPTWMIEPYEYRFSAPADFSWDGNFFVSGGGRNGGLQLYRLKAGN